MPESVKRSKNIPPVSRQDKQASPTPEQPAIRRKQIPQTEEAELGPEIQHGQLSTDELNSRNDL